MITVMFRHIKKENKIVASWNIRDTMFELKQEMKIDCSDYMKYIVKEMTHEIEKSIKKYNTSDMVFVTMSLDFFKDVS